MHDELAELLRQGDRRRVTVRSHGPVRGRRLCSCLTLGACSCRPPTSPDPGRVPVPPAVRARSLVAASDLAASAEPSTTNPRFVDVASQAGLTAVILRRRRPQGPPPRIRGHGGGVPRLRRRRPPRCLPRERLGPRRGAVAGSGQGPQCPLSQPGRRHVRGRHRRGPGSADESWGCGVCAGDYDNDGHVDLFVTNFGPDRLYRNRGDGTFEQMAEKAGVADPAWGAGCSLFDADGDGDLDLYVANYVEATLEDVLSARRTNLWREKVKVMVGPFGLRGGRDRFFRNQGDGTFEDATDAGRHDRHGRVLRARRARLRPRPGRRRRRVRGQRLEPELPLPQRRQGEVHRDRHLERRGAERPGHRPGRHGRRRGRPRRRRAGGHRPVHLHPRLVVSSTATWAVSSSRTSAPGSGSRRSRTRCSSGAVRSSTTTSTATSTS